MVPALKNPARVSSACNVLMGLGSDGFDALESALEVVEDTLCKQTIISTLASFNDSDAVEAIAPYALSSDPAIAKFATVALGTIDDSDVLEILEKMLEVRTPQ